MNREPNIVLIGNYPPDRLESMNRFAQMLLCCFRRAGMKTEIWYPCVFLGALTSSTGTGIGKWLSYIDKWVIYPLILRKRIFHHRFQGEKIYFHICDHSNAPYLKCLPAETSGITCHDVLAIRGALGYPDAYCPASVLGKILQKWILKYLGNARFLACVSQLTMQQLKELRQAPTLPNQKWQVIHNAFNADFGLLTNATTRSMLNKTALKDKPFLLHVGSALTRKNRKLLLDMVAILGNRWDGYICYAGDALNEDLIKHAELLGLQDRVISIVKPDHITLVALYNACDALIFPSFSEGFGWPVIEAQASGAPVIASSIDPIPEISGNGALHADPLKPEAFADAFLTLQNCEGKRARLIENGFKNVLRFESTPMTNAYLDLYGIRKPEPNVFVA